MIKTVPIETRRHDGSVLGSSFYLQEELTSDLAIIYPGAGYPCHGPALYYLTNLLIERGFDVLNVGYDYRVVPPFSQRQEFLLRDIDETFARAASERTYSRLIVGAKSIGTRGLAASIKRGMLQLFSGKIGLIWLTPGWNNEEAFLTMSSSGYSGLHIIGEADPLFDSAKAAIISRQPGQQVLVIPGADHSLDIDGDVTASIAVMSTIAHAYNQWLDLF